jgi:hypothetical protein
MLEPMTVVEVPGDGHVVEGAVGDRSVVPVARVASGGPRPDPELAERRGGGGSPPSTSCGCCARPRPRAAACTRHGVFDRGAAQPLAQPAAACRSPALVGERASCNPVEPRQRVVRQRGAAAPRRQEHPGRDLFGGLTVGPAQRVAVHRRRMALVESADGLHRIALHDHPMAGGTAGITPRGRQGGCRGPACGPSRRGVQGT